MNFFVLKKPAFLEFSMQAYTENASLHSKHQILSNSKVTNASLVKHKNGKWYLRYGDALLELKDVETKEIVLSKIENDCGTVFATVHKKWFVQNTCNL